MRATLAVARKELLIYFTTPLAWVLLMVVAFFSAQFFNGALDAYRFVALRAVELQSPQVLDRLDLTELVVGRLLGSVAVFLVIAAPFLSMRLWAEEKRARTFELLMTAPARPLQLVLGKYLAALAMVAACLAVVALFPLLLSFFARGTAGGSAVEWRTVATGLLGLFLLGAMAMAVGMFVSALTESVVVAALVSLLLLLGLWVITILTIGVEGPLRDLAAALSAAEHLGGFLSGRIELKDVVYYLSFVVLGLYLTDRAIEGRRWV
jgi:ABC-2 type transport system permease protein